MPLEATSDYLARESRPKLRPRQGALRLAWPPSPPNSSSCSFRRRWLLGISLLAALTLSWCAVRLGERWCYPLHHQDWIVKFARENQLRPSLVASVVREESRFRVDARSPMGAQGLMQLLPSTARWVSEDLDGTPFVAESLTAPEVNLRLGAIYLAHLRDRFGARPVLYLSAYNAGPRVVEEWLEQQEGQLSIPEIPFPETRAYVASVLRGQARYGKLYPGLDADL